MLITDCGARLKRWNMKNRPMPKINSVVWQCFNLTSLVPINEAEGRLPHACSVLSMHHRTLIKTKMVINFGGGGGVSLRFGTFVGRGMLVTRVINGTHIRDVTKRRQLQERKGAGTWKITLKQKGNDGRDSRKRARVWESNITHVPKTKPLHFLYLDCKKLLWSF